MTSEMHEEDGAVDLDPKEPFEALVAFVPAENFLALEDPPKDTFESSYL